MLLLKLKPNEFIGSFLNDGYIQWQKIQRKNGFMFSIFHTIVYKCFFYQKVFLLIPTTKFEWMFYLTKMLFSTTFDFPQVLNPTWKNE